MKKPDEAPEASAVAAAEAEVAGKLRMAEVLIDASGPNYVNLSFNYEEKKVLALAVMRLGGTFAHTGEVGDNRCRCCRSAIPDGNPSMCGLRVRNLNHWNC